MKLTIESPPPRLSSTLRRHRLPALALALSLACGAVLAYKLLASRSADASETPAPRLCTPADAPCSVSLPSGGRIDFSMAPAPIQPLKPLQLSVRLTDFDADQIGVVFQGVEMDMGSLPTQLTGNGRHFTGQAMLPVCTTGAMRWSATLHLTPTPPSTRRLSVPFHFDVPAR